MILKWGYNGVSAWTGPSRKARGRRRKQKVARTETGFAVDRIIRAGKGQGDQRPRTGLSVEGGPAEEGGGSAAVGERAGEGIKGETPGGQPTAT